MFFQHVRHVATDDDECAQDEQDEQDDNDQDQRTGAGELPGVFSS